jgi:hypothetical protein
MSVARRLAAVIGSAAVVAAVLVVTSVPALGQAPARTGWWSQASQGGLAAPPPPDVPPDGLYVQGGPNGPIAYAAVRYDVGDGTGAGRLRLVSTGVASPAAALHLCSLLKPDFAAAQGGPLAEAPAYDCAKPVAATVASDGSFLFDASTLVRDGVLAVAVLATGPTDRVPLIRPGDDSLTVTPAPPSGPAPPAVPDYTPGAASTGAQADAATGVPTPAFSSPSFLSDAAPAVTPAGSPPAAASRPAPQRAVTPRFATTAATRSDDFAAKFGRVVALAIVVAALLAYARGHGVLGGRFADT